MNYNLI